MTERPRLLTLMGSGETAPTMAKVHRLVAERLGPAPVDVVLLDTPYGFQENADEISRRAVGYLGRSMGMPVQVASWRVLGGDLWLRERALELVRGADLVFAGPGSPTYALRVWQEGCLGDVLAGKLTRGGAVTFGSAAAACLGIATVPVYEIYKVGADPHWVPGLDLLAGLGLWTRCEPPLPVSVPSPRPHRGASRYPCRRCTLRCSGWRAPSTQGWTRATSPRQ